MIVVISLVLIFNPTLYSTGVNKGTKITRTKVLFLNNKIVTHNPSPIYFYFVTLLFT